MKKHKNFVKLLVVFAIFGMTVSTSENVTTKPKQRAMFPKFFDARNSGSLDTFSHVVSPDCVQQLTVYINSLLNLDKWAIKMFDATAKVQSGILTGNLHNLGSYDECQSIHKINVSVNDTYSEVITGKYCLGTLDIQLDEQPFIMMLASCLPETCSATDLNLIANSANFSISFSEKMCHSKNEDPPITNGDIAFVVTFGIITLIMAVSSLYDIYLYYAKKDSVHSLLLAFSVVTNLKKLLATSNTNNSDQLECLSGIRTISMMWIVLGHTFSTAVTMPMINQFNVYDFAREDWTMFIRGATVAVDTFFLMAGIVIAYVYLKSKSQRRFNIFLYYLHRYLRLTPAIAALLVIHLTVLKHLGSGPYWYFQPFQFCEKYWWSTLLYIQNYVNPYQICLGPVWYLSVDTQLFVISPILLIPLKRWPKITLAVTLLAAVASVSTAFAVAWIYELMDVTVLTASPAQVEQYMRKYYMTTYCRSAPWFIGIIVGYIIYHVKVVRKNFKMPKILNAILWMFSLVILVFCVFYDINKNLDNRVAMASYISFMRPTWAIALSWIIFACVNGYGGPINAFLSLPIFQILARVTYSMYVLHYTLVLIMYYSAKQPIEFSTIHMMYEFWSFFALVLVASVIWTLTFESPIIIIEKFLLGGGGGSKRSNPTGGPTDADKNGNLNVTRNGASCKRNRRISTTECQGSNEDGFVNNAYVSDPGNPEGLKLGWLSHRRYSKT